MENQLLFMTAMQSVMLSLLTLAILFLGYQLWKFNQLKKTNEKIFNETPEKSELNTEGFCSFHSTVKAEATCAICEELICESCNRSYETLHFCPEHFKIFHQFEWQMLESIKTNPDDAHLSEYLFQFKKLLWSDEKSPLYIQVHYQINVQSDDIESEIQLYCPKDHLNKIELQLSQFKAQGIKQ